MEDTPQYPPSPYFGPKVLQRWKLSLDLGYRRGATDLAMPRLARVSGGLICQVKGSGLEANGLSFCYGDHPSVGGRP